jgi:acetylglutamate kinase
MPTIQDKVKFLIESLPYIRQFSNKVVVVKYGGHAMTNDKLKHSFAQNIALMKYVGIKPILVHGGGPQIAALLGRLEIPSKFCEGLRITDEDSMEVVEMVLSGRMNKEIVNLLNMVGLRGVGLSGKDAGMFTVRKVAMMTTDESGKRVKADLGLVGEVETVDTTLLDCLVKNDFIPVIAPIGVDKNGKTHNINADTAAGAVAAAMKAERFLALTDIVGVLDKDKSLLRSLSVKEIEALIADGTISGGMIPKIMCGLNAVRGGAKKAVIIDGRVENCLLLELFTDMGVGTEITHGQG